MAKFRIGYRRNALRRLQGSVLARFLLLTQRGHRCYDGEQNQRNNRRENKEGGGGATKKYLPQTRFSLKGIGMLRKASDGELSTTEIYHCFAA